jgi:hypothetical protein
MVDIPDRLDDHAPVFIYGVEGEQIEEENDAYNDLRFDIGLHKDAEEELDENYELMPSCWLVLFFDCCCVKISSFFKRSCHPGGGEKEKDSDSV